MSTLQVNTLKTYNSAPPVIQNSSGTEVGTFCRAWVNFNGTGTVAIRSSFNVSSITDNGTGAYTVNFTTALADANYAFAITAGRTSASFPVPVGTQTTAPTTTALAIISRTTDGASGLDPEYCSVAIFR